MRTISINEKYCKKCGICAAFCPKKVFDRDKLGKGIERALEKRPVSTTLIDQIVTEIEDEAYSRVPWALATDRVAVIHLLAADPARHRSGIGTRLLEKAREVARERGAEAIRLDTLPYNTPARRLYEAFGFHYRGDLELYYPSAGRIPFSMYEYLL